MIRHPALFMGIMMSFLVITQSACEPDKSDPNNGDNNVVKVFILMGQSNMVGQGTVTPTAQQITKNGGQGTLRYLVDYPAYDHLVTSTGDWVERDDVWIADLNHTGPLTVNGNTIGPELQFGHTMGDYYQNPVLIIKASWGGKSLHEDFRPPSSGGVVGDYYSKAVNHVHDVLNNIELYVPNYNGQGFEIAGIGWHQGWNDRIDQVFNDAYQSNGVNLINDLRDEFKLPQLPFVLAITGMNGRNDTHPRALSLMEAQLAIPADVRLKNGQVRAVETRDFYRAPDVSPANEGYHWNRNAETYLLIGKGLGEAMIELQ